MFKFNLFSSTTCTYFGLPTKNIFSQRCGRKRHKIQWILNSTFILVKCDVNWNWIGLQLRWDETRRDNHGCNIQSYYWAAVVWASSEAILRSGLIFYILFRRVFCFNFILFYFIPATNNFMSCMDLNFVYFIYFFSILDWLNYRCWWNLSLAILILVNQLFYNARRTV